MNKEDSDEGICIFSFGRSPILVTISATDLMLWPRHAFAVPNMIRTE